MLPSLTPDLAILLVEGTVICQLKIFFDVQGL